MNRGPENKGGCGSDRNGSLRAAESIAAVAVPAAAPGFDGARCPTAFETRGAPELGRGQCRDHAGCGVSEGVFDRGILDELASMLDDAELESYLALLEPTVTPRVEKLRRQFEAGEVGGLVETAHALAGGAACYGLSALSAVARQVENGARSEPRETLYRAVAEAADLVDASLSAVFRWRCRWRADRASPGGSFSASVAEACSLTAATAAR